MSVPPRTWDQPTWAPPAPPRRTRVVVALAVATLLVMVAVGAVFVTLPYISVRPGTAQRADELIRVDKVRSYPARGRFLLTTVSLGRVNAYEALDAWLDPDVDLFPERDIIGRESRNEYRKRNFQAMSDSKSIATFVALTHLGYDVSTEGDGAIVGEVADDLPAAKVLRAGEAVVAVDGKPVGLADQLVDAIRAHRPGDTVELSVLSPDRPQAGPRTVRVTLAAEPQTGAALLGVGGLTTRNQRFHFPVDISIDSGTIGGPSAGLTFTLALIDLLTPGELAGGVTVAATGTIDLNGAVGPVGGVAQKAAVVRRSGARLFLVPSAEYEEAVAHAGEVLRVEKVDTLDDALRVLATLRGSNALALGTPGRAA